MIQNASIIGHDRAKYTDKREHFNIMLRMPNMDMDVLNMHKECTIFN